MSESEGWTRLYLARWPTGAVTLLAASSMEHAADLLDQVDNAKECELVPFDGELWLTMRPADEPSEGPLALHYRPALEIDSQGEIIEKAFPVLHKVIVAAQRETADGDSYDEPIDREEWSAAKEIEIDRILSPSPEWKAAVERWWDGLGPPAAEGGD